MTGAERWATPEEIAVARARFEAAIPGWRNPEAYGVGRRVRDGIEFARINTSLHRLPAVILATVCGHTGRLGVVPAGSRRPRPGDRAARSSRGGHEPAPPEPVGLA